MNSNLGGSPTYQEVKLCLEQYMDFHYVPYKLQADKKEYCEIIIFRGGSISVDFVEPNSNEFTSPTENDVFKRNWNNFLYRLNI